MEPDPFFPVTRDFEGQCNVKPSCLGDMPQAIGYPLAALLSAKLHIFVI
jgi:hypothetical protein